MSCETIPNKWMIEIAKSDKPRGGDRLKESREVMRSAFNQISQCHSRLWITWDGGMLSILSQTIQYSRLTEVEEETLKLQWNGLVRRATETWKDITDTPILEAEPLNIGEAEELQMMEQGEGDNVAGLRGLDIESDLDSDEDW